MTLRFDCIRNLELFNVLSLNDILEARFMSTEMFGMAD